MITDEEPETAQEKTRAIFEQMLYLDESQKGKDFILQLFYMFT